jgi:hypothetical protein
LTNARAQDSAEKANIVFEDSQAKLNEDFEKAKEDF